MRNLIVYLFVIISCSGCVSGWRLPEVGFEWFNLSANEIWVTDAIGLPDESYCGRLMPSQGEDQLSSTKSTIMESVRIEDTIVIKWKENGINGWPHGVETLPNGTPATGVLHEATFKRADLGIPAKLSRARVRFTYLGGDKWRIKLYGPETLYEGTDRVKDFSPPYQKP